MLTWALLQHDGTLAEGRCDAPQDRVVARARESVGARLLFDGLPPLYVAGGPDLLVEARMAMGQPVARFWSVSLEGSRLWVAPDGSLAIASTFEAAQEIGRAIERAGG